MNNKNVIIGDKLAKCYRIGLKEQSCDSLVHTAVDFIIRPLRNYRRYRSLYQFDELRNVSGENSNSDHADIIWALKDFSFQVNQGEVIGIVGKNGAGKSTLLKILSRITEPTMGTVRICGRVASLLEVGTGFHPELTGRDNLYVNGTILGMKKYEIDRKFDEIVHFSGVEKYIDTPVKRYSSGMQVRLAFSIAAHLEPDILIVDEVLAVGDVAFQKKSLGRMNEIAKEGRTVLFVSHNMAALENLCTTGIWIDNGKLMCQSDITSVVSAYVKESSPDNIGIDPTHWIRQGNGDAKVTSFQLLDASGNSHDVFRMGDTIVLEFGVEFLQCKRVVNDLALSIRQANTQIKVLHLLCQDLGFYLKDVGRGERKFRVEIPDCMLYPGLYDVSIYIGDSYTPKGFDYVENIVRLQIIQSSISKRTLPYHPSLGIYHQLSTWEEVKNRKALNLKEEYCHKPRISRSV